MNYSDIFNFFMIIAVIILILTIFIKMPFHIILTSQVVNQDIKIDINLRYMFNIINIKIEIEEFYSDIYIGNTNIAITNFVYLFVNLVYGNLINIIEPNKFYMNIKPNFIENKIYVDFKIYIKPNIKNIINILSAMFIANKNSKKIKEEGKKYESNRINPKYNGNNA